MKKQLLSKAVSFVLCIAVLFGTASVGAAAVNVTDAIGDTTTLKIPFAFFRSEPNFSVSTIKGILSRTDELNVLGYDGSFVRVELSNNNQGYVHKLIIKDKRLNIKKQYTHIYSGVLKEDYVQFKFDLNDTVTWSLDKKDIVEVTKYNDRSFSVKGLSPGVVKLTVKSGDFKDTCEIACVEQWADKETATAQSNIDLMGVPGKKCTPEVKIAQGSTIDALGHIPGNSDYVYVSSGGNWGFIKLSDFPAIKHMMTQYHYYDKGYDLRFSSANSKISDYASVLNDVMMEKFGLKVFSYVKLYTSVADECKILSDGKVKTGNISNACPGTGNHKSGTCLTTENVRNDLKRQFGNGGKNISKVAWTGHIMTNNERSNGTVGMGTIVMTPYGTIDKTSAKIREDRIYTLVHETSHQLGVYDHYCAGDKKDDDSVCSNKHCSECSGEPIPYGCIMLGREDIENTPYTALYCNDCIKNISNSINNF